jgi:hypothetical protein
MRSQRGGGDVKGRERETKPSRRRECWSKGGEKKPQATTIICLGPGKYISSHPTCGIVGGGRGVETEAGVEERQGPAAELKHL